MKMPMRSTVVVPVLVACVLTATARADQKLTASAYNLALEGYYLIVDAGKDRGIYLKNGLDPDWITRPGRAIGASDLKDLIAQGTELGMSAPSEIFLARAEGLPVKIVAGYVGETLVKVYARADGPVKTVKDLHTKKVGSTSAAVQRHIPYISQKFGISAEAVPFTNLDNNIAALRQDAIDAIITAEARILALVDQGELRVVLRGGDYQPSPELNNCLWVTEDLIRRNPALVQRFVKATLETVRYLKEHPQYASQLVSKRTNMAPHLAASVVAQFDWTPSGQPGGNLVAASKNFWQFLQDTGAIPAGADINIGDMIDLRFLP
jgi:ABC-type nitrate/sulfonate/bicarbonate transport system substrate-binding protein